MAVANMATTRAQIKAQNAALSSQAQALSSQAQAAASTAEAQTRSDTKILQQRGFQESARITLEQVRRYRQGARERATTVARLGDAGVAGGSTVRDAITSVIQESLDIHTLETNRTWEMEQNILEQRAAVVRGQSQINQAGTLLNQAGTILDQRTSTGAGVLQMIGAGVSGYSQGKMLEPSRPVAPTTR